MPYNAAMPQETATSPSVPKVRLAARTAKARKLLREVTALRPDWDGVWTVLQESPHRVSAPDLAGPWLLVSPADLPQWNRWVRVVRDEHFEVSHA